MSFTLVVADTSLQLVKSDGTISTLTLPEDSAVVTSRKPRFAILGRNVIVVNGVSRPVWVDPDGTVRPLTLGKPAQAATVAAGSAGGLTGDYRVKVSFAIKNAFGDVLIESDLSDASDAATLSADLLDISAIPVSSHALVNTRRIYRTASGGSSYFHLLDIEDNTTVTYTDGTADEALPVDAVSSDLGAAPTQIELITAWKGRLWAKDRRRPDSAIFSADDLHYGWPVEFELPIKPEGQDERGLTAFLARRDELGVGKRDMLAKIVGDSDDDFAVVIVVVGVGPISQESVVVIQDIAYFLAEDGVYTWSSEGVECISDEKVRDWFASDTYFNRSRFEHAVAHYDPYLNAYALFLAAAGSTANNRWVYYTLNDRKWWGPHKSDLAITFGATALLEDSNDLAMPVWGGSDGNLYKKRTAFTDGVSAVVDEGTAIDFDVDTKFFSGDAPDITHFWGMPTILSKILASGTLTITPKVGRLNASAGSAISHNMTLGRERLRRLGVGPLLQLNLRQNTNAIGAQIYGIEIPYHEIGRR